MLQEAHHSVPEGCHAVNEKMSVDAKVNGPICALVRRVPIDGIAAAWRSSEYAEKQGPRRASSGRTARDQHHVFQRSSTDASWRNLPPHGSSQLGQAPNLSLGRIAPSTTLPPLPGITQSHR